MIKVVPVRDEDERLLLLSTFVAAFNQSQPQEYYLSRETEPKLEEVLTMETGP